MSLTLASYHNSLLFLFFFLFCCSLWWIQLQHDDDAVVGVSGVVSSFTGIVATPRHAPQQCQPSLWAMKKSRVSDPDGATPAMNDLEVEELDVEPLLEEIVRSDDLPRPIPHQPWRRGDTAGCEAPIHGTPWRTHAEEIITQAVQTVGGQVLDVTWYLSQLVVTLNDQQLPATDMLKSSGPPIQIVPKSSPIYYDPNDPEPEEILTDEDCNTVVYEYATADAMRAQAQQRRMMYATKDRDDPVDETHIPDEKENEDAGIGDVHNLLYVNQLTRDQFAYKKYEEARMEAEQAEQPMDVDTLQIDTAALSTIAKAVLDALEPYEEELQILSRHELILTSPGASDVLETQRQFDAYRGFEVMVETQDPFDSNRILTGKLLDRNSMDVMITKKGRMVTIPLNFVKCVRLPPAKREKAVSQS